MDDGQLLIPMRGYTPEMPLTNLDKYYLYEFDCCVPTNGYLKWWSDYQERLAAHKVRYEGPAPEQTGAGPGEDG